MVIIIIIVIMYTPYLPGCFKKNNPKLSRDFQRGKTIEDTNFGGLYQCEMTVRDKTGKVADHFARVSVKEATIPLKGVIEKWKKVENRLKFEEMINDMNQTHTEKYGDASYIIYKYDVRSAGRAEDLCRLPGGYLAELNDFNEWNFLQKEYMPKDDTRRFYFISGRRIKGKEDFYWPRLGKSNTA